MAWIEKTDGGRWKAGYRGFDTRTGKVRKYHHTFNKKEDAKNWLAEQTVSLRAGTHVDPQLGKTRLADFWPTFLDTRADRSAATVNGYVGHWRRYIEPAFGSWPLASISYVDAVRWMARMKEDGVGDPTRAAVLKVARMVLSVAVRAKLVAGNPFADIPLPATGAKGKRALSREEVGKLVGATEPAYRTFVWFVATTGLRVGEATALQCGDLDFVDDVIRVRRAVAEVAGRLTPGDTKTAGSVREIPFPPSLQMALADRIDQPRDALAFTASEGGPIRRTTFLRRVIKPAAKRAGIGSVTNHELRHTANTLWRREGVDRMVRKAVLGHVDRDMTDGTYGHVTDEDMAQMRQAMERVASATSPATEGGMSIAQ